MFIPFKEPVAPRYIHINPANNQVHLLVPVVGGQEISTDNTCKSTASLDEFFRQGAALRELNTYQAALEYDLQFLENGHPLKAPKQERLKQINAYLKAMSAMQGQYTAAITTLMQGDTNLYSIQLRPRAQDPQSRVVNPLFSINRENDGSGTPLSALFNALYEAYPHATFATPDPRAILKQAAMAALPGQGVNFEAIQRVLAKQCRHLFGLKVDFTIGSDGKVVSQKSIDVVMYYTAENPASTDEYMESLLGACALNLWGRIPTPLFYAIQDEPNNVANLANKTEKLSILTQFFLAHVNMYCVVQGLIKNENKNFGAILDASPELSNRVAGTVVSALGRSADVEESLRIFFNKHTSEFGLARPLTNDDMDAIKQKVTLTYKTVTATKENPHMDDFMLLDTTTRTGKFVTHQGSICTDFSELVGQSQDNDYFKSIRADFEAPHDCFIPHKNEHIQGTGIELDIDKIISRIKDDSQFAKLPPEIRDACINAPAFKLRKFQHYVAKGMQDEAAAMLAKPPSDKSWWQAGTITDYSGRTFTCNAYEYAYWAKDKHMCRMLEKHMDEETKAAMLECVKKIESVGLTYEQHGVIVEHSKHFDMTLLKSALDAYVKGYDDWYDKKNWVAIEAAWMAVGRAQRDVPAHVAQEYCRAKRSFDPIPEFDEDTLPRTLTFHNYRTGATEQWFPLIISDSAQLALGVGFALFRARDSRAVAGGSGLGCEGARLDLLALSRLDEVRTADLMCSRENLQPTNHERALGMV